MLALGAREVKSEPFKLVATMGNSWAVAPIELLAQFYIQHSH